MASFLTDDPRPPCIGELRKGCSMGNAELLVEAMAAKIQVLKERLAATEHRGGGHSIEACKLDCLMAMLPLLLGGPRAAAVAPAIGAFPAPDVSHLHSKISKLEAEKEVLKTENKMLQAKCDQLEVTAAAAEPGVSFEEIAKEAFEDTPAAAPVTAAPSADLQAQLDKVTRERAQAVAALEADSDDDLTEVVASLRAQIADCVPLTTFNELKTKSDRANAELAACIEMRDDCIAETTGVAPVTTTPVTTTPEPVVAAPEPVAAEPVAAPPEPGQVVMADNPLLGQGTCAPLTEDQRTYRVRKWNVNPDPRTGERVPGQTLRSVQAIVSSPLTKPSLDDVGTRDVPVPVKDSLQIEQQFGGHVQRLKEVYELMRPEIWTGANCEALQAQYVNDVKTMLVRLACQLVDAITAKAAANNVAEQVDGAIPDSLKAPCDETLAASLQAAAPPTSVQEAGESMVAALETRFRTWMERVEETGAGRDIVHGIFCPILSKAAPCVWPLDVTQSQAWGKAWNASK